MLCVSVSKTFKGHSRKAFQVLKGGGSGGFQGVQQHLASHGWHQGPQSCLNFQKYGTQELSNIIPSAASVQHLCSPSCWFIMFSYLVSPAWIPLAEGRDAGTGVMRNVKEARVESGETKCIKAIWGQTTPVVPQKGEKISEREQAKKSLTSLYFVVFSFNVKCEIGNTLLEIWILVKTTVITSNNDLFRHCACVSW